MGLLTAALTALTGGALGAAGAAAPAVAEGAALQGPTMGGEPLGEPMGYGQIMSKILERQKANQQFMANPLNRLAATFGFSSGPEPYKGDNAELINTLAGQPNASYANGLAGQIFKAPGALTSLF